MQIKRDGKFVALPVDLQDIPNININGFVPVIINISPVTNLPLLLGAAADDSKTDKTSANFHPAVQQYAKEE